MKYVAIKFDIEDGVDGFFHAQAKTLEQALNYIRADLYTRFKCANAYKFTRRPDNAYYLRIDKYDWYAVIMIRDNQECAVKYNYETDTVIFAYGDNKHSVDKALLDHWLSDINTMGWIVSDNENKSTPQSKLYLQY